MRSKYLQCFVLSAGAVLLAAAFLRFLIAAGTEPALTLPEPVVVMPLRYAVWLTGGLELMVAVICLFGRRPGLQLGWIAWLSTNYAVYRIGLVTMHVQPQATAIGSLTDPLHLARGFAGVVFGFLPPYLLLGSYASLGWLWWTARRAKTIKYLKMPCPACGIHIRFDENDLGRKVPCPQCQKTFTLRRPGNLKMSCFFCQGNIEFPSHALGEKMSCPHCNMDITLKEPV